MSRAIGKSKLSRYIYYGNNKLRMHSVGLNAMILSSIPFSSGEKMVFGKKLIGSTILMLSN
jgi:hypothetical protein